MSERTRGFLVVLYAAAMAWVEAAVVFDLRILIGRVEPYQPNPLPWAIGLGEIEIVRELATLIMIATVAALAGRTWRSRAGYAMLIFGTWDILYYVFLRPMSDWPRSLMDWDILFLIPLPWWGPVLAPALIAALLVLTGVFIVGSDRPGRELWPGTRAWIASGLGMLLALYTFMAEAMGAAGGSVDAVRQVLPTQFHWPLFALALALLALPLMDLLRQWARRRGPWNLTTLGPVPERL